MKRIFNSPYKHSILLLFSSIFIVFSGIPFSLLAQDKNSLAKNKQDITIENIGAPINTEYFEYAPLITADESILIFTYRGIKSKGGLQNEFGHPDEHGKYFEDIMVSYRNPVTGKWSEPKSISDSLNTNLHDASIALTPDGQKLLLYKDNIGRTAGDIYISELDSNEWQKPEKIKNINSNAWEGSSSISADMKTIYFSSNRRGGKGGRDIYMSRLSADGEWQEPVNIGEPVNSDNDEDCPFIHPDGVTLYFSSNGHNTMGGYDIFISHLLLDTSHGTDKNSFRWSDPENIGNTINTGEDDRFYVVSADGFTAYFSSERQGGAGLSDIYVVHQKEKHNLMLVKGTVYADDRPAESDIIVSYSESGNKEENGQYGLKGMYKSNSASGKYMMIFNEPGTYRTNFEVQGFPKVTEYFSASKLDTFVEIYKDIDVYSPGYVSPFVNMDGIISSKNDTPLAGVTIRVKSKSGQVSEQLITNRNGYFTLRKMPKDESYLISLSEKRDVIIKGHAFSAGIPYKGLTLNDTVTKEDGAYRLIIQGLLSLQDEFYRQLIRAADSLYIAKELDAAKTKYQEALKIKPDDFHVRDILDQINNTLSGQAECEKFFTELTGWKGDLSDGNAYREFLSKYGNFSAGGLVFKVQVGAYRNPSGFHRAAFDDLGKINSQLLDDGITRFTIGEFKTIMDAENLNKKARQRGNKDSFITFSCKGERKLFSEAINNHPR